MFRMVIDGVNGKDGVFTNIRMTMFLLSVNVKGEKLYQTRATRRQERFEKFWFLKFTQETERHSADILIGMLQVIPNCVAIVNYRQTGFTYHTRIISCFSFPSGFVFGHISQ